VDPRIFQYRLDQANREVRDVAEVFEGSALGHQLSVWLIVALGFVLLFAR